MLAGCGNIIGGSVQVAVLMDGWPAYQSRLVHDQRVDVSVD